MFPNEQYEKDKGGFQIFIAVIVGVALMIGIPLSCISDYLRKETLETEDTLRVLCRIPHDDLPNSTLITNTDGWGRQLKFERSGNQYAITQTIISAGKDGQFGTKDDLKDFDTDFNKSRMIGAWVSSRSKEFMKGFHNCSLKSTEISDNLR
jgi:hypothetical protein